MGVYGLYSTSPLGSRVLLCAGDTVVIDGDSLAHFMHKTCTSTAQFLEPFISNKVNVVCVFDGIKNPAKLATRIERAAVAAQVCLDVRNGRDAVIPMSAFQVERIAKEIKQMGVKVRYALYENDEACAALSVKLNAKAVIGYDSDYLVFPRVKYAPLNLISFEWADESKECQIFCEIRGAKGIAEKYLFDEKFMPFAGSVLGNDWTFDVDELLQHMHRKLLGIRSKKKISRSRLISEVFNLLRFSKRGNWSVIKELKLLDEWIQCYGNGLDLNEKVCVRNALLKSLSRYGLRERDVEIFLGFKPEEFFDELSPKLDIYDASIRFSNGDCETVELIRLFYSQIWIQDFRWMLVLDDDERINCYFKNLRLRLYSLLFSNTSIREVVEIYFLPSAGGICTKLNRKVKFECHIGDLRSLKDLHSLHSDRESRMHAFNWLVFGAKEFRISASSQSAAQFLAEQLNNIDEVVHEECQRYANLCWELTGLYIK